MGVPASTLIGIPRIRALAIGFAVALVLLTGTIGVSAVAITRVQRSTMELAQESHDSTYYLGDVGGQLALLRGYVALASKASPAALEDLDRRIARTNATLEVSISGVPDSLDPTLRSEWEALAPHIEGLRSMLLNAFVMARTGRTAQADEMLRDELATEADVYDRLDRLEQAHRAATMEAFREMYRRVLRLRLLEALLGTLLIAGTVAIWLSIIRTLGRQGRQLTDYVRRIEAMNQDLDAFAGRVAHDLRNALSPVVMGASMLRRSAGDAKATTAVSERIERSSARGIALVDGLLAFSRAARSVSEEGETASIRTAIDGAIDEVQPLVDRLRAKIEVRCDDVRVRCPQGLMAVVMANLCSNAVKFLEGCRERCVRIAARVADSWAVIVVEDTGPGIPEAALGRIFEPFFRVPGARAAGSGIGLATVARIVDRCGGTIRVDSTVGHGTRFEVRLPLASAPG